MAVTQASAKDVLRQASKTNKLLKKHRLLGLGTLNIFVFHPVQLQLLIGILSISSEECTMQKLLKWLPMLDPRRTYPMRVGT